jgi:ribose transport system ATP-binding protein
MASALSVRGLSKRYGSVVALADVSFDVAPASIHALVGANGSGKSTLIKVVAGVERAEPGGSISVSGLDLGVEHLSAPAIRRAGVRFVHQGSTVFPDLTVAENIGIGSRLATRPGGSIRWRRADQHAASLLDQLGLHVSPRALVGDLSPAVQTLVAVARAFADTDADVEAGGGASVRRAPTLMVLDEPTAALPTREVEILLAGLRRIVADGHAVVLVTHRLDEVARAADHATVLRDGRHVRTFPVAAVEPRAVVEMITGTIRDPAVAAERPRSGPVLLDVSGLCVGGAHELSFTVHEGEVVGIAGLLGSGRSTVLEALFGARERVTGRVALDGTPLDLRSPARAMRAGVALVPEQRQRALFPGQSLAENLSIADLPRFLSGRRRGFQRSRRWGSWNVRRMDRAAERAAAAVDVRELGIVTRSTDASVATLSGGNQQKVVLARWMRRTPRLLLLDEPTLGVDVGARAEIHAMVRAYVTEGRAALCVSSDVEELCAISDRILVLQGGRLAHQLDAHEVTPDAVNQLVHQGALT